MCFSNFHTWRLILHWHITYRCGVLIEDERMQPLLDSAAFARYASFQLRRYVDRSVNTRWYVKCTRTRTSTSASTSTSTKHKAQAHKHTHRHKYKHEHKYKHKHSNTSTKYKVQSARTQSTRPQAHTHTFTHSHTPKSTNTRTRTQAQAHKYTQTYDTNNFSFSSHRCTRPSCPNALKSAERIESVVRCICGNKLCFSCGGNNLGSSKCA